MGIWFGKKFYRPGQAIRRASLSFALASSLGGLAGCSFYPTEEEIAYYRAHPRPPPRAREDPEAVYGRDGRKVPEWVQQAGAIVGPFAHAVPIVTGMTGR
jgi:hypothetical protein